MGKIDWREYWQELSQDPVSASAFALLTLNGLSLNQIQQIDADHVNLSEGWITTADGFTLPLVTQAARPFSLLDEKQPFAGANVESVFQKLAGLEAEAHRRFAGAIWYTSEEGRVLMETAGISEAPILPLRFMFPISIAERLHPGDTSETAVYSRHVLQTAADWLYADSFAPRQSPVNRVLNALKEPRTVFLIASLAVSGVNFVYNILMGRLLTPADYGQLSLIITLQLLMGLLPHTFQTVTARFSSRYYARQETALLAALRSTIGRLTWKIGIVFAGLGLLLAPLIVTLFHLDSLWLVIPLLIAAPFFIAMGADRGFLQGMDRYWWMTAAYTSEALLRLIIGVLLVLALTSSGRALDGAVWGLAQAMVVTWFISWLAMQLFRSPATPETPTPIEQRQAWFRLISVTMMALVGQAAITNSDFLLVKNFFSADEAGLYAAVSVMGRIVYYGALPLTILLIPMIARRQALNEPTQPILVLLIGGGAAACITLFFISLLAAPTILRVIYGEPYVPGASLLPAYVVAASLYTLANLMISYRIALGHGSETWMPLLAGAGQIVALLLFHQTLEQVIFVQIGLMAVLLIVVSGQIFRSSQQPRPVPAIGSP